MMDPDRCPHGLIEVVWIERCNGGGIPNDRICVSESQTLGRFRFVFIQGTKVCDEARKAHHQPQRLQPKLERLHLTKRPARMRDKKPIAESTFTIAANVFADGPAQALRDFLIDRSARRVVTIFHPLVAESDGVHTFTTYENGKVTTRTTTLPFRPPFTYLLDPFLPLRIPKSDAWFGFNNLMCVRGVTRRFLRRDRRVYYWSVDFVPDRFGNSVSTLAYEALDRWISRRADVRIELSEAAAKAREQRLAGKSGRREALIVPMGAWIDRVPVTEATARKSHSVVYMGHLVPRQGVSILIRAIAELLRRGYDVGGEVIGGGPQQDELRALTEEMGLTDAIRFHGFVEDHREVERLLASCSIAVAPYVEDPSSFTRYADPGKLKAYLAAGLPIVMTSVPPNAQQLADSGAATVVPGTVEGFAGGIDRLIREPAVWETSREAALRYAQTFDWNRILSDALTKLGFS